MYVARKLFPFGVRRDSLVKFVGKCCYTLWLYEHLHEFPLFGLYVPSHSRLYRTA